MKRYIKLELVADYPSTISSDEAHDEILRMMDKWVGPNGVRCLTLKTVAVMSALDEDSGAAP